MTHDFWNCLQVHITVVSPITPVQTLDACTRWEAMILLSFSDAELHGSTDVCVMILWPWDHVTSVETRDPQKYVSWSWRHEIHRRMCHDLVSVCDGEFSFNRSLCFFCVAPNGGHLGWRETERSLLSKHFISCRIWRCVWRGWNVCFGSLSREGPCLHTNWRFAPVLVSENEGDDREWVWSRWVDTIFVWKHDQHGRVWSLCMYNRLNEHDHYVSVWSPWVCAMITSTLIRRHIQGQHSSASPLCDSGHSDPLSLCTLNE